MEAPLESWGDRLESAIAGSRHFDRVRVLRETASTQDAARAAAGGEPGLVLTASRQTGGRGRLGRTWEQKGELGVAVTLVVAAGLSQRLSMIGGLAALDACRGVGVADAMLKAPNDVVVPARGDGADGAVGLRKLGGVLVEQDEVLALVGVGINVGQRSEDFSHAVGERGVSLRMLGSSATRLGVIVALLGAIERRLDQDDRSLDAAWRAALVPTSP